MFSLSRLSALPVAVLSAGILLAAAAGPASAEMVLKSCTGTCGVYQVHDDSALEDIVCVDRNKHPNELYEITIRPPKIYGPTSKMTTVDWRFQVQDKSFTFPSHWKTIDTSPYQTATASSSVPAKSGDGFTTGVWMSNLNGGGSVFEGYRVLVEMDWWNNSGVVGREKIVYDWYWQVNLNGSHGAAVQGHCTGSQSD